MRRAEVEGNLRKILDRVTAQAKGIEKVGPRLGDSLSGDALQLANGAKATLNHYATESNVTVTDGRFPGFRVSAYGPPRGNVEVRSVAFEQNGTHVVWSTNAKGNAEVFVESREPSANGKLEIRNNKLVGSRIKGIFDGHLDWVAQESGTPATKGIVVEASIGQWLHQGRESAQRLANQLNLPVTFQSWHGAKVFNPEKVVTAKSPG